jgi:hypothetical protein
MAKNRLKLFRLTKQGLELVKKALMGYDSINGFYVKNLSTGQKVAKVERKGFYKR